MAYITRIDTDYALSKQLYKGISLMTDCGDIVLTEYEDMKLRKFLRKLLEEREKHLKDDINYNK